MIRIIFSYELLSTNTQVSKLFNTFSNGSSANMKLSKPELHKLGQSEGFLGRLLLTLPKTGLPLMKNVLKSLKRIKNEAKKQKGRFLSMWLGTLSASLLGIKEQIR